MSDDLPNEIPAPKPPSSPLTSHQAAHGRQFTPQAQIRLYSPDEWEEFVLEWAHFSLKPKYVQVHRFGGSGDRGVDIAGYTDQRMLQGVWDCYQCKRYGRSPLGLSVALTDVGKVLWHTFNGEYGVPRSYCFVAPLGAGTELNFCLGNPDALKATLIEKWNKTVRGAITTKAKIDLVGPFLAHVQGFDYSIFTSKTGLELVQEYRTSPHYAMRFGGGLPTRPSPERPPMEIALKESRYVAQLLAAYADNKKQQVPHPGALKAWPKLAEHFGRQREAFYKADSLRVFARDTVPAGTFESLEDEVHNGVIDVHDADHPDGFARVKAVTQEARRLQITANVLITCSDGKDRDGICHHLANKDRLRWTKA